MRLLQLNPTGNEDEALDLHPMLSVVTGLSPAGRDMVRRAVTALPGGGDPGTPGLLESHGIFLDLAPETLAMLDMGAEVDVVVGQVDVQGVQAKGAPRQDVGEFALAQEPLTAERLVELTPAGAYPELDAARADQADAREALQILRDAADQARAAMEEAAAKRRRAEAALEAARAGGRPDLRVVGDAAPPAVDRAAIEAEVAEAESELDRISRGIAELRSLDVRPLQVLLEAIRNPEPVELVPSERARELADEFEALRQRVAELEAAVQVEGLDAATAMAKVDAARAELASAERGMQKPDLSADDVAELESAHEEVLEAERKASGGLGKRAAQKRLDEARENEQAILDRVGYPTWSAYVMGATLLSIDPAAEERVNRAKFDLEAAEAVWARVTAELQAHPEHGALLEQLEAAYLEAIDLLGGDPEDADVPTALRELKVAAREVTTDELVDALAYQLELLNLPVGDNPQLDRTVLIAEAFLEEAAGVQARIAELEEERSQWEASLAVAELQLADADLDLGADVPAGDEPALTALPGGADLEALEAAVEAALADEQDERDFVEAREALLDAAIQAESVSTGKLKKVAAEVAVREEDRRAADPLAVFDVVDLDAADGDDADAAAEPGAVRAAVEFYLLARLAALRNLSFVGSVPLLIDDALAGLDHEDVRHLLGRLDRMADAVQVIYLSDDPAIAGWAEEVGFSRAAVVPAPAGF